MDRLRAALSAADNLYLAGQYEAARTIFVAAIGEYQRELRARPNDLVVSVSLGGALANLGHCLVELTRYGEAAEALAGAAAIFEDLCARDDPDKWRPNLADVLQVLAGVQAADMRFELALPASRRAIELRQAGPDAGGPGTANTLRTFAHVRALAGVELDEAQDVLTDALVLYMTELTRTADPAYLQEIYFTEQVQAVVLDKLGQHEAARRVATLAASRHLDALPAMLRAQQSH